MQVGTFLFLDFDGTLAPIASTPAQARMSSAMRSLIRHLARHKDLRVAVLSGRALRDLRRLVGVPGIVYAGNHGLEIRGPGIRYVEPAASKAAPLLARIAARLRNALQRTKGVLVENKRLTLSVHYRLVKSGNVQAVRKIIKDMVGPPLRRRQIRLTKGKKVLEIRPFTRWNKGKALGMILKRAQTDSGYRFLPIYVGDDRTDEDGWKAARRAGGFGVFVGTNNRSRLAAVALRNPRALHGWLKKTLDAS